jgi:hypothetical protein
MKAPLVSERKLYTCCGDISVVQQLAESIQCDGGYFSVVNY